MSDPPPPSTSSIAGDGSAEAAESPAFLALQRRADEAEANMLEAAKAGQRLLDQLVSVQAELEREKQEKHELCLRLEGKVSLQSAWQDELEHQRQRLVTLEAELEEAKAVEKENQALKSKLSLRETRESQQEEHIRLLETQLAEANEVALNTTVVDADHKTDKSYSEELLELQAEQVQWMQEKQLLQKQLLEASEKVQGLESGLRDSHSRSRDLELQLEDKECEVSSYSGSLGQLREELQELQFEHEQLKLAGANPAFKGNSLFSEVEDRRHLVEGQMAGMRVKYEDMKVKYDAKVQLLRKVRMHNAALHNMAGTRRQDTEQLKALEDVLQAERDKCKKLTDRIITLEEELLQMQQARSQEQKTSQEAPCMGNADAGADATMSSVPSHTQRAEYAYLNTMLEQERAKAAGLQKKLHTQMRQTLQEEDKTREASRQMRALEANLHKAKAETYQLKVKIDEMKAAAQEEGTSAAEQKLSRKKAPGTVFEQLHFAKKSDEKEIAKKSAFQPDGAFSSKENCDPNEELNEVFRRQVGVGEAAESGQNRKPAPDVRPKKSVAISASVECIEGGQGGGGGNDGGATSSVVQLNTDEDREKLRKPKTKKKYSQLIVADEETKEMQEQCNQQ